MCRCTAITRLPYIQQGAQTRSRPMLAVSTTAGRMLFLTWQCDSPTEQSGECHTASTQLVTHKVAPTQSVKHLACKHHTTQSTLSLSRPRRYCQLRMLCSFKTADGQHHEAAFVRWYDLAGTPPYPYNLSTYLKWETVPPPPGTGRGNGRVPRYSHIPVSTIDRMVLVQPDPKNTERFFLKKYIRCMP